MLLYHILDPERKEILPIKQRAWARAINRIVNKALKGAFFVV